MKQMKRELLATLANMIGQAIMAGDGERIEELSAWETFVQFYAPKKTIAQLYCEMWSDVNSSEVESSVTVQPDASVTQLSLF